MKSLLSYRMFAVGSLLALGLRFLANVFLARSSGILEFGTYLSLLVLPLVAIRLTDLSVQHALGFYVRRDKSLFSKGAAVLIGHSIATAPILLLIALAQTWMPAESPAVLRAASRLWLPIGAIMIASGISTGLVSLLLAIEAFTAYTIVAAISPGGLLLGAIILSRTSDLSTSRMIDLTLVVETIAAIMAISVIVILGRRYPVRGGVAVREFYSFGLRAHPGTAAKVFSARLDRLIIVALLPPSAVAVYSVAFNIRDILIQPMTLYNVIFTNRLISKVSVLSEAIHYVKTTLIIIVSILGLGLMIAVPLSPWFFSHFYGNEFMGSARIFTIISPTVILIPCAGYLWSTSYCFKRPGIASKAILISTIPSSILLYTFTKIYGSVGASWAVLFSQILSLISALFMARKVLKDVGGDFSRS